MSKTKRRRIQRDPQISPDGTRLVKGSLDKTARIWQLPPRCQVLIDAAKQAMLRELTPEERARAANGDPFG